MRKLSLPFFLVILSLACAVPGASAPEPLPTFDPNSMQTSIVETAVAAQTQTASNLPTSTVTPTPTRTPSPTPTPSATFIFALPSFTPIPTFTLEPPATVTSESAKTDEDEEGEQPKKKKGDPFAMTGKEWTCSVLGTFPPQNTEFKPNTKFKVEWEVFNSGTKSWPYYGLDMVYTGGYRHEGTKIRDFVISVPSGGKIGLQATFIAPKAAGEYSTYFFLLVGKTKFCQMRYSFSVAEK